MIKIKSRPAAAAASAAAAAALAAAAQQQLHQQQLGHLFRFNIAGACSIPGKDGRKKIHAVLSA